MAKDNKLVKAALLNYIKRHKRFKKNEPYMTSGRKVYTMQDIYDEIDKETEEGIKHLKNIISVTLTMLREKDKK